MVIFDTKGDFKDEFYRPGDIIFSNGKDACGADGKADFWNIINELKNDEHLRENIIEISHALFSERLKNSKEAFFPMAAREVMGAILYHAVQKRRTEPRSVNNAFILQMINKSAAELRGIFDKYPPYKYVNCFIPEEAVEQTEGVMAELLSVVQPLLVGNFGKPGSLSIRDLIKAKGGRRIFIEYDIGVGNMLTPIYTLLFDLAIKEALCRDHSEGNVFMIADEFKLLPNLRHIDDAVNFGRSLGLKFMIGIQNVDQIIEIYGESRAKNIFSGFMSHFAFPVSDYNTRKYIKERAGENITCTEAYGHEVYRHISKANVVEDWDMAELVQGECIVMLNHQQPFNFKFEKYEPALKR
jgi:type IV secretory pathway TraG/TraD family ATPase VirD4